MHGGQHTMHHVVCFLPIVQSLQRRPQLAPGHDSAPINLLDHCTHMHPSIHRSPCLIRFWWTTPGGISKSPTSFAEYRIEVFRPPDWFNVTAKPQITEVDPGTWDAEDEVGEQ